MNFTHIFFDLDGTLTDSMPGITRAVQYALRRYGIEAEDLNALIPFVGPPLPDSFKEYYHFSEKDAGEAVLVFREYYTVTGWKENAPYPGIEESLKTLKSAGKRLYVATSKPESMAKKILEYFGLSKYFELIGGADENESRINQPNVRVRKDEVIRYVLSECGITDSESVLMVGDRRHDIEGAHKTGIKAAGVLYGYGSQEELERAGADWILESTNSLMRLAGDIPETNNA